MTVNLLSNILKFNKDFSLDISRLLILFDSYSQKRNDDYIVGTTKVVKLDFFLRYPTILEKALRTKKQTVRSINVKEFERNLVESTMIRYKFGPWDDRYWSILSTMESLGVIEIAKVNGVTSFKITETGKDIVSQLNNFEVFDDYFKRSSIVNSNFGRLTAKWLVKKVYELRPELRTMKFGEEIRP